MSEFNENLEGLCKNFKGHFLNKILTSFKEEQENKIRRAYSIASSETLLVMFYQSLSEKTIDQGFVFTNKYIYYRDKIKDLPVIEFKFSWEEFSKSTIQANKEGSKKWTFLIGENELRDPFIYQYMPLAIFITKARDIYNTTKAFGELCSYLYRVDEDYTERESRKLRRQFLLGTQEKIYMALWEFGFFREFILIFTERGMYWKNGKKAEHLTWASLQNKDIIQVNKHRAKIEDIIIDVGIGNEPDEIIKPFQIFNQIKELYLKETQKSSLQTKSDFPAESQQFENEHNKKENLPVIEFTTAPKFESVDQLNEQKYKSLLRIPGDNLENIQQLQHESNPNKDTAFNVFISYSSKDSAIANKVCSILESMGLRCWIAPRNIEVGLTYPEGIMVGLEKTKVLLLVYSRNADLSRHVNSEVERAFSKGHVIIPFRVEDYKMNRGLEYLISSSHWVDALTEPREIQIREVGNIIKKRLDELTN